MKGLGIPHSRRSDSRAGLGSPPKPGRSRRRPRSLRCHCRRRRGACSSSPYERPTSCQCAGATARPRGWTGTSQAGRSDGNKGQWRGAGARGPEAAAPGGHPSPCSRREGSGSSATEPRSGVSGAGRGNIPAATSGPVFSPKRSLPIHTQPHPSHSATRESGEPRLIPRPFHAPAPLLPGALSPTCPPSHPHPSSLGCRDCLREVFLRP